MYGIIRDMGFLRTMLYLAGILIVIFSPSAGTPVDIEWPGVLTTVVVPAIAPLIFMVIFFDLIMSRVVGKGRRGNHASSRRQFVWIGWVIAAIILLRWLPYLLSLS